MVNQYGHSGGRRPKVLSAIWRRRSFAKSAELSPGPFVPRRLRGDTHCMLPQQPRGLGGSKKQKPQFWINDSVVVDLLNLLFDPPKFLGRELGQGFCYGW